MKNINVLLFDNFTTLDALGPAEFFGRMKDYFHIGYFSISGGEISGSANVRINTKPIKEIKQYDILLVPGGLGTRTLVNNSDFIEHLKYLAEKSGKVLCVCTGSALLAKTGLLDGINATSNKMAWEWVIQQSAEVHWIRKARWIVDGKFYTSSGISAGIDMALGFIEDHFNRDAAILVGRGLEYVWNSESDLDPFA